MRRLGRTTAATVAAALAPATAAAQAPKVAGVTEISGTQSGYVDVQLPSAARMDFTFPAKENESFAIKGGQFAAVVLRGAEGDRSVVAAARFAPEVICGDCPTPYETLSVGFANIESQASVDRRFEIPGGRYRLYLFTDGTPTKATIRFAGLSGRLTLAPEWGARPAAFRTLPMRSPGAAQAAIHSGSDRMDGDGLLVTGGMAVGTENGNVELNGCTYEGEGETPGAFAPGCPGGVHTGSHGFTYLGQEGETMWGAGFVDEVAGGTWSAGGSILGTDVVAATGWAAAWIPYAGDGTRLAAAEAPAPAGPPTPAATSPAKPSTAVLKTGSARLRGGRIALRLGCSAGPCSGTLRVAGGRRQAFKAPATVRVKLPASVARKVRRRGRATVKLVIDRRTYSLAVRR